MPDTLLLTFERIDLLAGQYRMLRKLHFLFAGLAGYSRKLFSLLHGHSATARAGS